MFGVGELLSLPLPDNHQQTDSSDVVDRSLANLLTIDNYMPMPTPPAFPARGLYGHLIACMAGAAVDNVFRLGVSTTLAALAASEAHKQAYGLWVMILFTVPFLLFAPTAGSLGDRIPKHFLIRGARLADVLVCCAGILGVWLHSVPLMLTSVTLLATISAFFAPVKLSIVPELVSDQDLPSANGKLASLTVIAILGGMGLAALTDNLPALFLVTGLLCVAGVVGAWMIPPLIARAPTTAIAMPWSLIRQVKALNSQPGVWIPALSLAGFWALGAAASVQLVPLVQTKYVAAGETGASLIAGTAMALGIGLVAGSILAVSLVSRAFPAGLPIAGALIASFCLCGAGFHVAEGGGIVGFSVWLLGTGFGAGLWEVPITITLQERAEPTKRNLVMSGVTILNTLSQIVLVAILIPLTNGTFGHLWVSYEIFMLVGGVTLLMALTCLVIYRLQFTAWMMAAITRTCWNLTLSGGHHLPPHGGCLIVCNHLSYADGVALCARLDRPVRFLVYRSFFKMPVVGWILHALGAIPVAAEDGRNALLASLDAAVEALKRGEVVAIFPEGKLTRSGAMDRFKSGLERIAARAEVPILPVYLDGLYGTWMSRAVTKEWLRLFRRVAVHVGPPLPSTSTAAEARRAVAALGYEVAYDFAAKDRRTLAMAAIGLLRQHPTRVCVRDAQGTLVNWQALGVARTLFSHLALTAEDHRVGVVLPPGRAGTLVNLALAMGGITSVNLNHTSGPAAVKRMCEMAGIRTIITAAPYLKRIGNPELPGQLIHIEAILPKLHKMAVLWQTAVCMALPARWTCVGKADDVATIVFSSGSTGDPKGVQLTHRHVLANCRAVRQGLDLQPYTDVVLSPLPLFHSFGLIPGMWLGLTHGLSIAAHPDPTDGKTIGELAHSLQATFMLSTPTFVRGWMRRIEPEQFKSIRLAVVGAERCPAELKAAFKERYGTELLEGYGCTELCPTIAVNLPEVRRDREVEIHSRDGSVGRALPGLDVFTVDVTTGEKLPPDTDGLIVVRSPSRMLGYLDRPDLTEKAFVHGGYNTGDIGRVDTDGFIRITGRLARFAKIAGEMVPLDNVEALLLTGLAAQSDTAELAVAAVADDARGERLVVLHTAFAGDWAAVFAALEGQPALWKPKQKDLAEVAEIPKLGSGKRDLAALKKIALERFAPVKNTG